MYNLYDATRGQRFWELVERHRAMDNPTLPDVRVAHEFAHVLLGAKTSERDADDKIRTPTGSGEHGTGCRHEPGACYDTIVAVRPPPKSSRPGSRIPASGVLRAQGRVGVPK